MAEDLIGLFIAFAFIAVLVIGVGVTFLSTTNLFNPSSLSGTDILLGLGIMILIIGMLVFLVRLLTDG